MYQWIKEFCYSVNRARIAAELATRKSPEEVKKFLFNMDKAVYGDKK